jgi:hypothetical protein
MILLPLSPCDQSSTGYANAPTCFNTSTSVPWPNFYDPLLAAHKLCVGSRIRDGETCTQCQRGFINVNSTLISGDYPANQVDHSTCEVRNWRREEITLAKATACSGLQFRRPIPLPPFSSSGPLAPARQAKEEHRGPADE